MFPSRAYVLAALLAAQASTGTAIVIPQDVELAPRQAQAFNCSAPQFGLDQSCWDTLNVTGFVNTWWAAQNATTCPSGNFDVCFLNEMGLATTNCSTIVNDACTPPSPASFSDPRAFYTAYAIYAINQAFNSYYNAICSAGQLATEQIGALVSLLDFPEAAGVTFDGLLTSMSAALTFINPEAKIFAGLARAAISSSSVATFMFPPGSAGSQQVQASSLSQSLGGVTEAVMGNINSALPLILGNVTTFLSMAGDGTYSEAPNATLFSDTHLLLSGMNTYLVSQALNANNIILTRALNYDINAEIASDGGEGNYATGCGKGYDSEGTCDVWWHDPKSNVTYGLMNWDSPATNYRNEMVALFSNWTTPELLFAGAAACADSGDSQKPLDLISITPSGVDSSCLANMKVCTWANDFNNPNTEFSDCTHDPKWLADDCSGGEGTAVPWPYIGVYLDGGSGQYCRE